jgi:mRNA interferase MazF
MRESDVVLTVIAQADGKRKNRPALLLRKMPRYGDFLVCGISTQLHQVIPDFDEIIEVDDVDFIESGLRQASLVRLSFLAVVRQQTLLGVLGSVSADRHQRLLSNLSLYLRSSL